MVANPIVIACAALTGRIYAGKLNKARNAFLDGKQDVTSDVLKAVIDHVTAKAGRTVTVTVDGKPKFDISVAPAGTEDALRWSVCRLYDTELITASRACELLECKMQDFWAIYAKFPAEAVRP